jgi:hypothetical protein
MTIGSIVFIVIVALSGLFFAGVCIYGAFEERSVGYSIASVVIILVTCVLCFFIGWYQLNTESGKRALKDQQSNLSGGIMRTVQVYDVNGEIIKEYEGKFDVETDKETYILFDDEDGKRHIVYFTTGTIVIDEK